jgi:hypothetical protein
MVPRLKPGRPPRPHPRDGFLDLTFIALELQRLQRDNAELRKEFTQIRGHLYKVAQRLNDTHSRTEEILRLVGANLAPIDPSPPTERAVTLHSLLLGLVDKQATTPDDGARAPAQMAREGPPAEDLGTEC